MLFNTRTGCVIELVHYTTSKFIFKEPANNPPTACNLRGLTLSLTEKFTVPIDFQLLTEAGERGDLFPGPDDDYDSTQTRIPFYLPESFQIPGWKIAYSQNHVVIGGIWGCEIWLVDEGFVAVSSLFPGALVVNDCRSHTCARDEAVFFLHNLHLFFLEYHDFASCMFLRTHHGVPCCL